MDAKTLREQRFRLVSLGIRLREEASRIDAWEDEYKPVVKELDTALEYINVAIAALAGALRAELDRREVET